MRHTLSFLLLASLALAGCGGDGSHSTGPRFSPATLVGTWTGTYGVAGSDRRGTVTLKIAERDQSGYMPVTGTVTDPDGVHGTVNGGAFHEDFPASNPFGDFDFKFDDPGSQDQDSSVTHTGFASLDARDHLIITHQGPHTTGNVVSQDDFDLVRIEH